MYSLQGAPDFRNSGQKKTFTLDVSPTSETDEASYIDSYHVNSSDDEYNKSNNNNTIRINNYQEDDYDDDDFIPPIYSDHGSYSDDIDHDDNFINNDTFANSNNDMQRSSKMKKEEMKKGKKSKKSKSKSKSKSVGKTHSSDKAHKKAEELTAHTYSGHKSSREGHYNNNTTFSNKSISNDIDDKNNTNTKRKTHKMKKEKQRADKSGKEKDKQQFVDELEETVYKTNQNDNISIVSESFTSDYDNNSYQSSRSSVKEEHILDVVEDRNKKHTSSNNHNNSNNDSNNNSNIERSKLLNANINETQESDYEEDFENEVDDVDDDDYISSVHDSSTSFHQEEKKETLEKELEKQQLEEELEEEEEEKGLMHKGLMHSSSPTSIQKQIESSDATTVDVTQTNNITNPVTLVDKDHYKTIMQEFMIRQQEEQKAIRTQLTEVIQQLKQRRESEEKVALKTVSDLRREPISTTNTPITLDAIKEQVAQIIHSELQSARNDTSDRQSKQESKPALEEEQQSSLEELLHNKNDNSKIDEAHSLFTRLAHDVREVFHELNLTVVAAEKERLLKDERYRSERAEREREEQLAKEELLRKEIAERASRESTFWSAIEKRESQFREFMNERIAHDDDEKETRLKRELEERATRLRQFEEFHTQLLNTAQERLQEADHDLRTRDHALLQGQLEDLKKEYEIQFASFRKQAELDRNAAEERHKAELDVMQTRHNNALEQMNKQHVESLTQMQIHNSNTEKLEKLIACAQDEMRSAEEMNATITQERVRVLAEKEKHLEESEKVLTTMMDEIKRTQEDLHNERIRIATVYSQFELALRELTRKSEEDRRTFTEAMLHYDTYREETAKEHAIMLTHIAAERKALSQQREEWLNSKLDAMNELHMERVAIAQERTDATVARERQNRTETHLLQTLHEKEDEYNTKLAHLQSEQEALEHMKREAAQEQEKIQAERATLESQRNAFVREKDLLLNQFHEVKERAEETGIYCERLQEEVAETRAMKRLTWPANTISTNATTQHAINNNNNNNNNNINNSNDDDFTYYNLQSATELNKLQGSRKNVNVGHGVTSIDIPEGVESFAANSAVGVVNSPRIIAANKCQYELLPNHNTLSHAATKFQIDLANQRAILNRINLK